MEFQENLEGEWIPPVVDPPNYLYRLRKASGLLHAPFFTNDDDFVDELIRMIGMLHGYQAKS